MLPSSGIMFRLNFSEFDLWPTTVDCSPLQSSFTAGRFPAKRLKVFKDFDPQLHPRYFKRNVALHTQTLNLFWCCLLFVDPLRPWLSLMHLCVTVFKTLPHVLPYSCSVQPQLHSRRRLPHLTQPLTCLKEKNT